MSKVEKLLFDIMCCYKDSNITFHDLRKLLELFGFSCRVKGDHFIFTHDAIEEIINIQPKGSKAKAYQVKQIRNLFIKYRLGGK